MVASKKLVWCLLLILLSCKQYAFAQYSYDRIYVKNNGSTTVWVATAREYSYFIAQRFHVFGWKKILPGKSERVFYRGSNDVWSYVYLAFAIKDSKGNIGSVGIYEKGNKKREYYPLKVTRGLSDFKYDIEYKKSTKSYAKNSKYAIAHFTYEVYLRGETANTITVNVSPTREMKMLTYLHKRAEPEDAMSTLDMVKKYTRKPTRITFPNNVNPYYKGFYNKTPRRAWSKFLKMKCPGKGFKYIVDITTIGRSYGSKGPISDNENVTLYLKEGIIKEWSPDYVRTVVLNLKSGMPLKERNWVKTNIGKRFTKPVTVGLCVCESSRYHNAYLFFLDKYGSY